MKTLRELRGDGQAAKNEVASIEGLISDVLSRRCDLSASAPEHHVGMRAGHRQALAQAVSLILQFFGEDTEIIP